MDTKHMEYFKAVYEERSIHAAAKKLFISPQGLGRILKSLEEEFDAAFFVRGKGGVIPTEAGRIFYGQCAKTGDELARMKKQIRRAAEKPERLHVGFANGVLQLFPIGTLFGFIREAGRRASSVPDVYLSGRPSGLRGTSALRGGGDQSSDAEKRKADCHE